MRLRVYSMFRTQPAIKEYKLLYLFPDIATFTATAGNSRTKIYRKLIDKFNRLLLEAKKFVDQGNTSIMDGDRSEISREVEAIEQAINVANELKLEKEADLRVRKEQKEAEKKLKEWLDQISHDIATNGRPPKVQKLDDGSFVYHIK